MIKFNNNSRKNLRFKGEGFRKNVIAYRLQLLQNINSSGNLVPTTVATVLTFSW